VRLQGHRDILQKRGARACEAKRQTFPPRGYVRSAGQKALRGKKPIYESLFFSFMATKVLGFCGQEQTNVHLSAVSLILDINLNLALLLA